MASDTIFIIEDEDIQREELALLLQQQGYHVFKVKDGHEALRQLSRGPLPQLILLDMLTPNGHYDGWWFLEQRQTIPELTVVPVLILTGLSVASDAWAASLGASGLIRKPFEDESLLAAIQRCLSERR